MSVAASHSEYQIYLINIAPIYDKKQPKKNNLEIMLCFQFLLRRLITTIMLLPTIVYYYKKKKTYTSKNAQILPSNQNQQKKSGKINQDDETENWKWI